RFRSRLVFPAAARVPFPELVAVDRARPGREARSRGQHRLETMADRDRPLDLAPTACRNVVTDPLAWRYGPPGTLRARPARASRRRTYAEVPRRAAENPARLWHAARLTRQLPLHPGPRYLQRAIHGAR